MTDEFVPPKSHNLEDFLRTQKNDKQIQELLAWAMTVPDPFPFLFEPSAFEEEFNRRIPIPYEPDGREMRGTETFSACEVLYGRNPDPCYLKKDHTGPHVNKWGTTWRNDR